MNEKREDMRRIADYFSGREEISALYFSGEDGRTCMAVLLKDGGLDGAKIEALTEEYQAVVDGLVSGPVEIVVLNTSSAETRHQVLRTWALLMDRNRRFRLWFTERTVDEYLGRRPISAVPVGEGRAIQRTEASQN